jgi:hypothetical protein
MGETFLNIGAGKLKPLRYSYDVPTFLINVDTMYQNHICTSQGYIEQSWLNWYEKDPVYYHNHKITTFMESTIINFDEIAIYRYLEHVPFTDVLYFIYLLSTITSKGSNVDVIVPDYKILAKLLEMDDPGSLDFEKENILLTTELLNDPSCPHASIWTPDRARYFFELEDRFKVKDLETPFEFDGRDVYLRFIAERL